MEQGESIYVWAAKALAAYALPASAIIYFAVTINSSLSEVVQGQNESILLMQKIGRAQDKNMQSINRIEVELADHKLRLVSVELQLSQLSEDEGNRKTNP